MLNFLLRKKWCNQLLSHDVNSWHVAHSVVLYCAFIHFVIIVCSSPAADAAPKFCPALRNPFCFLSAQCLLHRNISFLRSLSRLRQVQIMALDPRLLVINEPGRELMIQHVDSNDNPVWQDGNNPTMVPAMWIRVLDEQTGNWFIDPESGEPFWAIVPVNFSLWYDPASTREWSTTLPKDPPGFHLPPPVGMSFGLGPSKALDNALFHSLEHDGKASATAAPSSQPPPSQTGSQAVPTLPVVVHPPAASPAVPPKAATPAQAPPAGAVPGSAHSPPPGAGPWIASISKAKGGPPKDAGASFAGKGPTPDNATSNEGRDALIAAQKRQLEEAQARTAAAEAEVKRFRAAMQPQALHNLEHRQAAAQKPCQWQPGMPVPSTLTCPLPPEVPSQRSIMASWGNLQPHAQCPETGTLLRGSVPSALLPMHGPGAPMVGRVPGMAEELRAAISECGVPQEFSVWLETQSLHTIKDVAHVCTDEGQVDVRFIALAQADPVARCELASVAAQSSVRRLWAKCRHLADKERTACGTTPSTEAPLNQHIAQHVEEAWVARHGFSLHLSRCTRLRCISLAQAFDPDGAEPALFPAERNAPQSGPLVPVPAQAGHASR